MTSVLLLMLALGAGPGAPDTIVVAPPAMRAALAPWVRHREAQGHTIVIVDSEGSADTIRARIVAAAAPRALRYVVLVGDVDKVPTFHPDAKVNVHFNSTPTLASDNPYGDFDADGIPEVAVGRLPADTSLELKLLVAKILAYEQSLDFGPWRRRINFIAGVGGFNSLADMAIEAATKTILCQSIPAAYATTMTYASWRSPYCPAPSMFRDATLDRLNEGCLFWVYLGHGQPRNVDAVRVPGGAFPILSSYDTPRMRSASGAPIALFLACYTGAFDATADCLAEEMLRTPRGPIAIVCGSRVTMPYAMSILGLEMLGEIFDRQQTTIGDVLLHAKRNTMLAKRDDARSRVLDSVARLLNPAKTDLADERAEHVLLFNLLGDPLLRLRHPEPAEVTITGDRKPGAAVTVRVQSPIVLGDATVELVVRRDRLAFAAPERAEYDASPSGQNDYQMHYERANDTRLASVFVPIRAETFEVPLTIPAEARGPCHVRVFVRGKDAFAMGSVDLEIE